MPERVTFKTRDDVTIVGDWQPVPSLRGAIILVHMMPETRKSWGNMQRALTKRGIASLAIDLRGHGESLEGSEGEILDYKRFTDEEHESYALDALAALDWLRGRDLTVDRVFIAGASIGANVALQLLAEEPRMPGAILFSAGRNYHGLQALVDAQDLLPHQALMLVAAQDDAQPFEDTKALYEEAPVEDKTFLPYKIAGHGTAILNADSGLGDKIAEWAQIRLNTKV